MKARTEVPVQRATPAEERQVIAALVLAFSADPLVRWMYPDPYRYLQHFADLLRMLAHVALEQGAVYYTEDFSGAAIWLAPGAEADEDAFRLFLEQTVPKERQAEMFSTFEEIERLHPGEPCWYLPYIGVEPARQRRGYGAALLRHALAVCDREGRMAFLEATSPANARLYRRHGFELVATVQQGAVPPLVPMVRLPGGASAQAGR